MLRHELAILRRQTSRPRLTRADRTLLTVLSRSFSRSAWTAFPVKPETLLRWHRQLVARRSTYPHRSPGRPRLERSVCKLILRLADRRRADGSWHHGLGDLGPQGHPRSRSSAGAGAMPLVMASVPARASGERARLRLPQRRDRLPAADLRPLLHLAGDATDRVRRLHSESGRRLVAQQARSSSASSRSGFSSTTATPSSAAPSTRSSAPRASK